MRLFAGGIVAFLLCLSAWYAVWYYSIGLAVIAPEFVEAGFDSNWFDWVEAGVLLVVLFTATSLALAREENHDLHFSTNSKLPSPAMHETVPLFLVFFGTALAYPPAIIAEFFDPFWGTSSTSDIAFYIIDALDFYLPLAISLLVFQIFRQRRIHGAEMLELTVPMIDTKKFMLVWFSMAIFVIIGIPVIAAFSFSFWLGPWYLW